MAQTYALVLYLYDGLKAAYPDITYTSTTYNENENHTIDIPASAMWDTITMRNRISSSVDLVFFDNRQESTNNTNVTVFIGE